MTEIVYDRNINVTESSVISEIFYNETEQLLFVRLNSNVLCGYKSVPDIVFSTFESLNQSGDSVGHYWNRFVKNDYEGFSTTDITLVPRTHYSINDVILHQVAGPVEVGPEIAPEVDLEFSEFVVTFSDNINSDNSLAIVATSVKDAVERFNKIVEIAGWENVKVTSVTQYFN